MTIGLNSPGTGWVAFGIGDEMEGSTMIMGGVADNSPYCADLVGLTFWEHVEDTTQGGEDNILECDAKEDESSTTLEFILPFNSSDTLDPVIEQGKVYNMFLGNHRGSDSITTQHTGRSDVFSVYLRPPALNVETILTLQVPDSVEHGHNFTIFIELKELKDQTKVLENVPVIFFMETQFDLLELDEVLTDSTGKANITYSNPHLENERTFGAKSREQIKIQSGEVLAYMSNEITKIIDFLPGEEEEEPYYRELSRQAILVAFWTAGVVIWGSFTYSIWGMIEIFRDRNSRDSDEEDDQTRGED